MVWPYIFAAAAAITVGSRVAIIALGKHLGRVARARREAEYLAQFTSDRLPEPGVEVEALIAFRMGQRVAIRVCHWPHVGWVETKTLLPVLERVVGWRPAPPGFRSAAWALRPATLPNLVRDDEGRLVPHVEVTREP